MNDHTILDPSAQPLIQSPLVAFRIRTRRFPLSSDSSIGRPRCSSSVHQCDTPFDLSARVDASEGRIDQLDLKIELGLIKGDHADDIPNIRRSLGGTSSLLFNSAPLNGSSNKPLNVRSSQKAVGGIYMGEPLVNGKLLILEKKEHLAVVTLHGKVNPIRAARFRSRAELRSGTPSRLCVPVEPVQDGLSCLDGNNNVLPFSISTEDYRRREKAYLMGVSKGIISEIRRSSEEGGAFADLSGLRPSSYTLNDCEVAFDQFCPDAVSFVRAKEKTLMAFSERARRIHHVLGESDEAARLGRAFSVRLRPSKTMEIVIYAKCEDRLRLEVRFKRPNSNILPGRQSSSIEELIGDLDLLRSRASDEINALLSFLEEEETRPSIEFAKSREFQRAWLEILGWREGFDLLRDLQAEGLVRKVSRGSREDHALIEKARRIGLLRFDRRAKAYRLNPDLFPLTDAELSRFIIAHKGNTQHSASKFVTHWESTELESWSQFPPSPPSFRSAEW